MPPAPAEPPAEPPARTPARTSWVRTMRRGAGVVMVTLLVAVLAMTALEVSQALHDRWWSWDARLLALPRDVLGLGVLVVWAVVLLLVALTGRLWVAATTVLAGAAVAAFANDQKMRFRGEPVYPSDVVYLGEPGFLVEFVGPTRVLGLGLALAGALVAGFALARLWRRRRTTPGPALPRRQRLLVRGVVALASGAVVLGAAQFHAAGNPLKGAYEAAGVIWRPWDQPENYAFNGFVAGSLYNMPAPAMDPPAGYDAATMADLTRRYREVAAEVNATRDPRALEDTNVVIVLAETLSDPTRIPGVRLEEDPIRFTRSLMAGATSGEMLTPAYGGGTANAEFEVLTGMALRNFRPQLTTPYQMLLPRNRDFPSLVTALAGDTHRTVAIHPFLASYYQRETAYPVLGFDKVEFEEDMEHTRRAEPSDRFVSDRSAFQEVVDELRDSERPAVVSLVTMQNHGPMRHKYDDPLQAWGPVDESMPLDIEQYLRGLRYSDEAMEQLVADLDELGERTVVLVYGDHLPSAWPESLLRRDPSVMFRTPYLVHANFETEKVPTPPVLGPTFLVNQLMATVDAPLTPYQALLERLSSEVPAFEPTGIYDAEGRKVAEDELTGAQQRLLRDYRLVQYDLAVGARHSAEEMLEAVPGAAQPR